MKIIDKLDLTEIKNFCYSEDSVKGMKMKSTDGGKYLQTTRIIRDLDPEYTFKTIKIYYGESKYLNKKYSKIRKLKN